MRLRMELLNIVTLTNVLDLVVGVFRDIRFVFMRIIFLAVCHHAVVELILEHAPYRRVAD